MVRFVENPDPNAMANESDVEDEGTSTSEEEEEGAQQKKKSCCFGNV